MEYLGILNDLKAECSTLKIKVFNNDIRLRKAETGRKTGSGKVAIRMEELKDSSKRN
jgi:hypothetical protein